MSLNEPVERDADTFGALLRFHRRQSRDPLRGGTLTQERLGELIGAHVGDAGYSGAAVSEWERDRSKIHADDRIVLVSLLAVLAGCGGLAHPQSADDILAAGNYRRLNDAERRQVFPELEPAPGQPQPAWESVPAGALPDGESSGAEAPSRRAKQLILLEKVHSFWVEGVLRKSLGGVPVIPLKLVARDDLIEHPWSGHLGQALLSLDVGGEGASISDLFAATDCALLLTGGPGSGKTTTLISLADALLQEARRDWRKPVPVILDLSSWKRSPADIAQWAVEELAAKYQIPRRYGRKWMASHELLLLLDGLDTLSPGTRSACVDALNAFRQSHGLTGIAVCCRLAEYLATEKLLGLNGAIALLPLDEGQLQSYLAQTAGDQDRLREAIGSSAALRDLASNPLMLNVMTAVFAMDGRPQEPQATAELSTAEALFEAYVGRMFGRCAPDPRYTRPRTMAWLSWLAARMNQHNQNIFLIEQIQPSWLPGRRWRQLYLILAGLLTGLSGGVIMWLLWRLLRLTLPQLPAPTSAALAGLLGLPAQASEPLTIILGNLALGLLLGLALVLLFEQRLGRGADDRQVRRWRRQQTIWLGLGAGLLTFLFVLLFSAPLLALAWAVAEGFMYAAAARYVFGWSYRSEVRTVEALAWSWSRAAGGALIGLLLALVAELIETLLYGYNGAARTVSTLVTAGFLLGGLRGRSAVAKSRPNQGVWLSLRNSLIAALALSAALALLSILIRDAAYAWQIGLLSALVALALMGGTVFIKHFLLRAMLRYLDLVPWRYARFLDYGARLTLMRKVGNGYIFLHGLLQAYLAGKR